MKKKHLRIKNEIVLSIKYAILKEAITIFDDKLSEGKKSKKLNDDVSEIINNIERSNNPNNYSLITNDTLNKKMAIIDKSKKSKLIKHSITIEILIDDEYNYINNENTDFIKSISKMLYDKPNKMYEIKKNYDKTLKAVKGVFYLDEVKKTTNIAVGFAKKIITSKNAKIATTLTKENKVTSTLTKLMSKKVVLFTATTGLAVLGSVAVIQMKKRAKTMSSLDVGDLAKTLTIQAMNIEYMKIKSKTLKEYNKYLAQTFKEINYIRKNITKELFEKRYEIESNSNKLELLNNFDNYIINVLKDEKKRG